MRSVSVSLENTNKEMHIGHPMDTIYNVAGRIVQIMHCLTRIMRFSLLNKFVSTVT